MARYEITDLCSKIRKIEAIPTSSSTFTDEDLTELLNMELQSYVVPVIQKVREEYFVIVEEVPFANVIDIPPEAIGMRLRDVASVNGAQLSNIPRLNPEEQNFGTGLFGYIIRNNQIIFSASITGITTIQLSYYKRPNDLTSTDYVKVTSKNGSNVLGVTGIPLDWAIGTTVDVIGKTVPFIGKKYGSALVAVGITTITVDAATYASAEIGDYISTEGYSPVPQYIPVEAHNLLIQSAAMRCLESLGDREGWKVSNTKLEKMEADLINLLAPRVDSQSKKVINRSTITHFMRGN